METWLWTQKWLRLFNKNDLDRYPQTPLLFKEEKIEATEVKENGSSNSQPATKPELKTRTISPNHYPVLPCNLFLLLPVISHTSWIQYTNAYWEGEMKTVIVYPNKYLNKITSKAICWIQAKWYNLQLTETKKKPQINCNCFV